FQATGKWLSTQDDDESFGRDRMSTHSNYRYSEARWVFDVNPGRYRVWATWVPQQHFCNASPFMIFDPRQGVLCSKRVDQSVAPDDLISDGASWEQIFETTVSGNTLDVRLSNDVFRGTVIADAIRIERLSRSD
ncbi:MAG: hypothetical protein AAF989_12750, partial [Planctomycetota bacterium]